MPDGTEGAGAPGTPAGAQDPAAGSGDAVASTDGVSQLPAEWQEALSDPQQLAGLVEQERARLRQMEAGANSKFEEAARIRKAAQSQMEDAEFGRQVRENPTLMNRVMGMPEGAPGGQPYEQPINVADALLEGNEDAAVAGLRQKLNIPSEDRFREIVREEFRASPQGKVDALDREWGEIQSEAIARGMTAEQTNVALGAFMRTTKASGADYRDVPPEMLKLMMAPYLQAAESARTATPTSRDRMGTTSHGARGPTAQPHQPGAVEKALKEGREVSNDDIYNDPTVGGAPGELEQAYKAMQMEQFGREV